VRTLSGWQVTDVPRATLALVAAAAGTLRVTALLGLVPFLLVLSTTRVRSRR
jgi:hypothetical protein